jgi:hypothetical protein
LYMLFVHLAIFHQMSAFVKDLLYDVVNGRKSNMRKQYNLITLI